MSPEAESLNGREGEFLPDNNHFYYYSIAPSSEVSANQRWHWRRLVFNIGKLSFYFICIRLVKR